jgi:hypothetical protein
MSDMDDDDDVAPSTEGLNAAIENAVAQFVAEHGGGMVTAWHYVASVADLDGGHSWLYATAPNQRGITTMGLLQWAEGVAKHEQRRHLSELEGD